MKRSIFILLVVSCTISASAQNPSYAMAVAETAMNLWKDSFTLSNDKSVKWRYDQGVVLKGIEGLWLRTGDPKWFNYLQRSMDVYVGEDGSIKGYKPDEYNIDHLNNGKLLLTLYEVTGKEKYRKALNNLYSQVKTHPRTSEGSFWHKKIYPNQVWLDGLYMGQPFYAGYAYDFGDKNAFKDITRQFVLIEKHARDPKTGLLYHGWDELRQQKWADPKTGLSPHVWARALGWYGMAMVDVLDYFPKNHPGRDSIIQILNRFAKAVTAVQDAKTGLWYDIVDLPKEPKNYFEASGSSMLVYTLAKGVRKGYLPAPYLQVAKKGYKGIIKQFIKEENGLTNLYGTVSVSGLGGNPYRDGSFAYYMSEPVIVNDPKGVGAFINAANEMELSAYPNKGQGKTVLLDYYFNNEWKKDATGRDVRFHYVWEDRANSGFSTLGNIFNFYGFRTDSLSARPTAQNLKNASVYIIVDPDTEKETAHPNFMNETDAQTIAAWVKNGGVLVLMGNDAGNAELKNFNILASRFGIRFNEDNFNMVKNDQFEQGVVVPPADNAIFKNAHKLYVKELSTLSLTPPAYASVVKDGRNIIAIAKYGKGTVFVLGDPWIYNEYVDGRKLPLEYDNYKGAEDLVIWIANQANTKK